MRASVLSIVMTNAPLAQGKLLFTFDDGPSEHTPPLLEALEDAGAKAIFFMVGEEV